MSLARGSSTNKAKYTETSKSVIQDNQSGTSTSKSDISDFQKPYIEQGFAEALRLYQQGDTSALTRLLGQAQTSADGAQEQAKSYLSSAVDKADATGVIARANAAGTASVNDPTTQALIDANASGITRNLTEEALPAVLRGAVAGGNSNSSRTGIAEGIARRGTAEAIANMGAGVNADAFNRGYTSSIGADQANTQALFSAASGFGNLFNTGVSAAQLQQQQPFTNFNNLWNVVGGNVWGTNDSQSFNQTRDGTEAQTTAGDKTDKTRQRGFTFKF